jgi:antitoxin (DNA-binding transcriptional repressor) of toxin-antitoxin stability system
MTKIVEIGETEASLRDLLSLVVSGDEVVFAENSRPVARLVPVPLPSGKRVANLHRGEPMPTPDFDDPLPDDFWLGADETTL